MVIVQEMKEVLLGRKKKMNSFFNKKLQRK